MPRSDPRGGPAIPKIARPAPLRESVFEALLDLIIDRRLSPGSHLAESELAELLGVSRQPIREALQLLGGEGWVDLYPGHGAFVHVPTLCEADQLLVVRSVLETEAARLAAIHRTDEGVAGLRALCALGTAAADAGDVPATVKLNGQFHHAVTIQSGNAVLCELCVQIGRRVRWYYAPVAQQRGHGSWMEHATLVDAIEAGKPELAAQIMGAHTKRTRDLYLSRLAEEETAAAPAVRRRRRRAGTAGLPVTEPVKLTQMSSAEPPRET
ncbi:GntR family transcriptional regulator [Sphaerisporangium aureirubrum]|uniref:GntR family transcriptional regulator n=1 Tax=Sphaerisporangium aureirubrum TaxID=1544736 RepID=A0ABW1N9D1_9ACTN